MSPSFFWDVTQCRLVIPYRCFGAACRPHLQGSKSLGCSAVLISQWALRCVSCVTARSFVQSAQQYAVLSYTFTIYCIIFWPLLVYTSSIMLHAFEVMVYAEVLSPFPCSLIGLFFVYSLKMPVSPECMDDVVLLTRNFLLLHFIFPPSVFMLLTWNFICCHASR
jgi:hypothetical protein